MGGWNVIGVRMWGWMFCMCLGLGLFEWTLGLWNDG